MGNDQKRIFLAMVLSGLVLFFWQAYVVPQNVPETPVVNKSKTSSQHKDQPSTVLTPKALITNNDAESEQTKIIEKIKLKSGRGESFSLTNDLRISDIEGRNTVFDFLGVIGSESPFEVLLKTNDGDKRLLFTGESDGHKFRGTDSRYGISLLAVAQEDGSMSLSLNSKNNYHYKFLIHSSAEELENRQIRQFVVLGKDIDRSTVGDEWSGDGTIQWFGIDFNFHLFSFIFAEKTVLRYQATENGLFSLETVKASNSVNGRVVFLKKNYDELTKQGDRLNLGIDFGFFGIVAVPLLRGIQFIYNYIPNYGWAIILLTLFVRIVLFPLQLKSIKSMKKMQVLQPELQKVKEKFKDDPQRIQKETMELFKKNGANPLGGCLPMIMQMPVFFAFYQVLYNSVELVGAPFIFWVQDLSIKDPFYVLPVGMGIAMFFQQKLMPSTSVDPTQKKLMMFMPVIFCFFMKDLPAGLNLYIFTSTILGIVQQLVVYKITD